MVRPELLKPSASRRGAAAVELAVSLMLFVPVLLYSIYAGEAFLAATRAQEAELTAAWDVTAYLGHDYATRARAGDSLDPDRALEVRRQVASVTGPRVMKGLPALDSFLREGVAPPRRRMVVSEQELVDVRCEPVDARDYRDGALLTFEGMSSGVRAYLHRGGYTACRARVRFRSPFMPGGLREGFHAKVDLVPAALREGFWVCGMGRSLQGCGPAGVGSADTEDPGFVVLMDDWALEDARESPVSTASLARNQKYANVGERMYLHTPTELGDGSVREVALGTEQIREVLLFLLDDARDFGDTTQFKFGFRNPSSQVQTFEQDPEGEPHPGHLTPWDDGEPGFAGGSDVRRSPHHYLGHPDADFNQP
ncbi:hypothetical protein MYSTI_06089 [Myxococcus stipitatus DSM 14675]|uniref:Pilus assembly protein n=1 Tax=Myxococcus stipitatus (strain DSM 14675 / JCM 12634 / Mx s8) TaxID=1278073 RepID=L7UII9_MYXSD|nr:hypothetical protein [Myxococcus stipitatus]AGC47362.1 hypothetical protein MYSTI_06089 [Myxococcus stipitatus DSM 14675]